jgi:NADH-quinone oxidoreductase subunit G
MPMLKQGGVWTSVDWQTALEYVANGLKQIKSEHGAASIGALVSPHSTLEELHLATSLLRGLGSHNIDYRLRNAEFVVAEGVHYLGTSVASLSELQSVLVVGSSLRKDHPLFAQRIRQAARKGCSVNVIQSISEDWAMPVANTLLSADSTLVQSLANIAAAVAADKGISPPAPGISCETAINIAKSLQSGERKAILLGNAAAHHGKASSLLALANWIGEQTGASVGYLTEAANTVGAQLVGAMPGQSGLNAGQMLSGALKAVLLLNTEPEFDSAIGASSISGLSNAQMVMTLSPFKSNMALSDVLLPIAPFTETSGTFVNAEGRVQSFHAVVKPLAETRPAWKVLRVLANMLDVPGFDFDSSQDVLKNISGLSWSEDAHVSSGLLNNKTQEMIDVTPVSVSPVVASIYTLDAIVRRAQSLQQTADGKRSTATKEVAA